MTELALPRDKKNGTNLSTDAACGLTDESVRMD